MDDETLPKEEITYSVIAKKYVGEKEVDTITLHNYEEWQDLLDELIAAGDDQEGWIEDENDE